MGTSHDFGALELLVFFCGFGKLRSSVLDLDNIVKVNYYRTRVTDYKTALAFTTSGEGTTLFYLWTNVFRKRHAKLLVQ